MIIASKRVYDEPSSDDGYRVLVDRLWPRGVSKVSAQIDLWPKEITPSNELRKWYHAQQEGSYDAFVKKYEDELKSNEDLVRSSFSDKEHITLLTAVKDIDHSHVPVLQVYIKKVLQNHR